MAASNSTNSVDSSLWFDSFSLILTDLENLTLSSDTSPSMVDMLKENLDWFLNTLNKFKPPSESSKMALNSAQVNVGLHKLIIKPQFKELALKLSSIAVMFFSIHKFSYLFCYNVEFLVPSQFGYFYFEFIFKLGTFFSGAA
ncbi:unnamed protein product [Amaranthus hypochondriacus]